MTVIDWVSVALPAGLLLGGTWGVLRHWRALNAWLERTIELL